MNGNDIKTYIQRNPSAYGGILQKKRAGRRRGRPLHTKFSMHVVLRSSQARGQWSFLRHKFKILHIIEHFSDKYQIKILSMANVGNHIHMQVRLRRQNTWNPFIRAITSAIVAAVTKNRSRKFWDYRPFTNLVFTHRYFLKLKDYIEMNQLEGVGLNRAKARRLLKLGILIDSG